MTEDHQQRKQEIRERIEKQRRSLTPEWVAATSAEIVSHLKGVPQFRSAAAVHTYVAWRNEVNTHPLIKDLLAEGRRVAAPVVDLPRRTLVHSLISNFEDLRPGAFGILEPAPEKIRVVNISEIDVVLVPGVAFDLSGNRIGYGGGYYDEFLRHTGAFKIALCYHFQIVDEVPVRAADERVNVLVTEKGVYEIK
jgi:5-formyltetrahydrofolate cyclo-ligase